MNRKPAADFTPDSSLRVSVATYNQVVFPHPEHGEPYLALERKATVSENGGLHVHAQPFGGAVRILNAKPLTEMLGELRFDSERSKQEQDFRILISPSKWEQVKQYCLRHLEDPNDRELESAPDRELQEEFQETIGVDLQPDQYTAQPMGFVIENNPAPTRNWRIRGYPTVRIYRTFRIQLLDPQLWQAILAESRLVSDEELGRRALESGARRANSVLALPLRSAEESFLALPPEMRYGRIVKDNHVLDESVLVVLENINSAQYQRIYHQ